MMPERARRMCGQPGCWELAAPGGSRCAVHAQRETRPTSSSRGYGTQWRRARAKFLAANPVCCDPYRLHPERVIAATDVDHIVPRRAGGGDVAENLQALCHSCHSHKTQREQRGMAV